MRRAVKMRSAYEASLMEARSRFLDLDSLAMTRLRGIFSAALRDVSSVLNSFAVRHGGVLRRSRLGAIRDSLDLLSHDFASDLEELITDSALIGARIDASGHVEASRGLLSGYGREAVNESVALFSTIPEDAVRVIVNRHYKDGLAFSDRIWGIEAGMRRQLNDIVARGVAEGKSAMELAKEIEPYLRTDRASWLRWKREASEIARGVRKRRSRISYEAKRLARTEINNAYREAQIMSAEVAPWVEGVQWQLSATHRIVDICDDWAGDDSFGMGEGIFPPREAPIDHPNGMCYMTDVLVSPAEMDRILSRFGRVAA